MTVDEQFQISYAFFGRWQEGRKTLGYLFWVAWRTMTSTRGSFVNAITFSRRERKKKETSNPSLVGERSSACARQKPATKQGGVRLNTKGRTAKNVTKRASFESGGFVSFFPRHLARSIVPVPSVLMVSRAGTVVGWRRYSLNQNCADLDFTKLIRQD